MLSLGVALALALGCAGCAGCGGAAAASMFLRKTEGAVAVADAEGAEVAPKENLGLYSGYTVGTEAASYAWIDLDRAKLAKLDENSASVITQDGKNLSVEVTSGSLFFNVSEPLAEDETMEIRSSSMIVGIRGTCGWVEVPDAQHMNVYLLEGTVSVTAGESTATVNAGEAAALTADGGIEVSAFTALDVPDFVTAELREDEALAEAVSEASGLDASGSLQSAYADVFLQAESTGSEVVFAEEIDFEADGSPELLLITLGESQYDIWVYRKGAERSERLNGTAADLPRDGVQSKISLVEAGGRLYVCFEREYNAADGSQGKSYGYHGSTAPSDGDRTYWGRVDYVWRHRLNSPDYTYKRCGLSENGLRESAYEDSSAAEYESVIAQYTEVRVLVGG